MKNEKIIVVGGGHAGCEAALATSRLGINTVLITSNINNIADMPCNPSIGGPAKGIVVREIDALGGEMGKNSDKSMLQIKMLNTKKGPAVRSLRAQIDKIVYKQEMFKTLRQQPNLKIIEDSVTNLLVKNNKIIGIETLKETINSSAVILTTGTYMNSLVLRGMTKTVSGPHGEKTNNLSNVLKDLGFNIKRLKTGTPPRIEKSSIDFSQGEIQRGDDVCRHFSYINENKIYDIDKQWNCYLIHTNKDTHKIILENLSKSSMYGGVVEGVGPRYCPSIEDKIVRFKDKETHQLFLEPESAYYDDIYLQGFSSSMPIDVQDKMIRTLPGLKDCIVNEYAYAIEYDAIDSLQLKSNLETKIIENFFTAGQINGTSGYEEAACQGLIAGINAVRKLKGEDPFILSRSEAYIGVLIDDLVTKGVIDPYRLLTSRAEHRLLLRDDNADFRLTEKGKKLGLVTEEYYQKFLIKKSETEELEEELHNIKLTPTKDVLEFLDSLNTSKIYDSISLYDLLKRPELNIVHFNKYLSKKYSNNVISIVETNVKYKGYIDKEYKEIEKLETYEKQNIPKNIKYENVPNLSLEAVDKLTNIQPENLGQALRISGININDIIMLQMYLKGKNNE